MTADAGLTYAELGERVGLSESQCLRRVQSLEETKVIQRYVTLIDPNYLNCASPPFVEVRVQGVHDAKRRHLKECSRSGGCRELLANRGEADYLLRE